MTTRLGNQRRSRLKGWLFIQSHLSMTYSGISMLKASSTHNLEPNRMNKL